MESWQITALGAAPQRVRLPVPTPAEGEVLVRVAAVGLNFADLLMIEGKYQVRVAPPYIPGMEFAGVVEALGPGTTGPVIGTRVLGTCSSGALTGRITVPALVLTPCPTPCPSTRPRAFPSPMAPPISR